jgi:hypothetical protein
VPGGYWASASYVRAQPGLLTVASRYLHRLGLTVFEQGPLLFGYDRGYPPLFDAASWGLATVGLVAFCVAWVGAALRAVRGRRLDAGGVLCLFTLVNVGVAVVALPYVPGNPRYLLFLAAPAAVLLARACDSGWRRALLAVLIGFGALGSLGQAAPKLQAAAEWRGFVHDLEQAGVRYCYSDYYLASRITFFSGERVLCSSKLGPITTEYFLEFRERVDRAPSAAIVAVNKHSAEHMEGRLRAMGVGYERLDLMKPVLTHLSRKVDPQELFPGRDLRARPE